MATDRIPGEDDLRDDEPPIEAYEVADDAVVEHALREMGVYDVSAAIEMPPVFRGTEANSAALATITPGDAVRSPIMGPREIRLDPEKAASWAAGTLVVTPEQKAILLQKIPDEDFDVKPTGEVFVSQVRYRRILNDAFGPGAWGMRPAAPPMKEEQPTRHVAQELALYVYGQFVAQAWGEQDFEMGTNVLTFATALEGCKSTALVRCCKDLGIASEAWDRHFTEKWLEKYCVQVWVDGKKPPQWRRKDAKPFYKETGLVKPVASPQQGGVPAPKTAPATPPPTERAPESPVGLRVLSCEAKPGTSKKTGKPYTKFEVGLSDGTRLDTFSETHADIAQAAIKGDRAVEVDREAASNPRWNGTLKEIWLLPLDGNGDEFNRELFKGHMERMLADLGPERFNEILGGAGYAAVGEVPDGDAARKLYKAMSRARAR